ncbi:BRCT domain-containing protein [Kordiimonas pumila]|uniref:BRCT domain-containing protein n=1 Tax=Kordiimonas pumila TaxID=2161677 RepID=A0ABV7D9J0_9PROT|nr:BRCT domain-containing protein [Kordiimonas pumila]
MGHTVSDNALIAIHRDRNRTKMFRNALGFLQGIVADDKINATELQALHTYMLECADHFDHGDIVDVLDVTEDLVAKAHIDKASQEDLLGVIDCIIEYQTPEDALQLERLEEFLGVCSGLIADDAINQAEAERFQQWLNTNEDIVSEWPACDISRRLNSFLNDGILDKSEAAELLTALKHLVGGSFAETGSTTIGLPIEVTKHLAHDLTFEGKTFCFTGKFFFGKRAECEATTREMGGLPIKDVTKKLDYLVVGSIASPFWLTSHFGTKIKRVMSMREDSFPYLVGEDVWRQSIKL